MASSIYYLTPLLLLFFPSSSTAALVEEQPPPLKYHHGPLLKGTVAVNLLWYGAFTPARRSIIVDFLESLNSTKPPVPSASSWWRKTERYSGVRASVAVAARQILDDSYSMGKSLKTSQIVSLAAKISSSQTDNNAVSVVLTADDVRVDGFCTNRCGTHGSSGRFVYAWVGDAGAQCPGYCGWPFERPAYGPQEPPLVAPNGDASADGMVVSLAAVLAGAVTNPFGDGYYQGSAAAPLEAVTACAGVFGKGAYPGYAGEVMKDEATGGSYNAHGVNGRRYLLPAMWDPRTSRCSTVV